ncbi:MAG: hypothetical protein RLZZ399_1817 [Verrucomicrobiota bacterium]
MFKTAAGHDRGKIFIRVAAGVAHAGAEHDECGVEERFAFGVAGGLEFFEEPCEAAHVFAVHLDEFLDFFGVISVVREGVIALAEHFAIHCKHLAAPRDRQRNHPGRIGLEGKGHQVVQDAFTLNHEVGCHRIGAGKHIVHRGNDFGNARELFADALFDFAYRREVFLQLVAVHGGHGFLEDPRILGDKIERTFSAFEQVLGSTPVGSRGEQLLVDGAWSIKSREGHVTLHVTHGLDPASSRAQNEGGEAGGVADHGRDALVEGDVADFFSAQVIRPVAVSPSGPVVESREQGEFGAQILKGAQGRGDFIIGSRAFGVQGRCV